MRYDYDCKRKAAELYRQGIWPETPDGIKNLKDFHCMIRHWIREEDANGPEVLRHKNSNNIRTPEENVSQFNFTRGKCYISPILDTNTNEIISYDLSTSPNRRTVRRQCVIPKPAIKFRESKQAFKRQKEDLRIGFGTLS